MTKGGGDRAHLKRQLEERGHCGILGTNDWAVQLVYSKKKKHQALSSDKKEDSLTCKTMAEVW